MAPVTRTSECLPILWTHRWVKSEVGAMKQRRGRQRRREKDHLSLGHQKRESCVRAEDDAPGVKEKPTAL